MTSKAKVGGVMSKVFLGIDCGLDGALAAFNPIKGELTVIDMPTTEVLRNGKQKREVSAPLVAAAIRRLEPDVAMVERVNAMPKQGVSSVFSFGRSAGIIEGALGGLFIPFTLITPQSWQKAMKVRDGKDGSRARAAELMPAYAGLFEKKNAHGRSDAALIAYYLATM
jgi:crossover junction endodeoxyribonuclease RuvC